MAVDVEQHVVVESIQRVVRDYLKAATQAGIPTRRAVLFGFQARGNAGDLSDIDLVLLSPALEPPHARDLMATLWRLCVATDARIILEIARREGVVIEV